MKKSLVALAALAVAGVASAQSSVTLFGVVDASISGYSSTSRDLNGATFLNPFYLNQGSVKVSRRELANSGYNSSRLGFRGTEDLGGGLAASFWLEAPITNDDGATGVSTFNRRSTVSLSGGFGEVRLGRDYTPTFWNNTVFDPFGTNGVGTNLIQTAAGDFGHPTRASNTIGYFLPPNLGGFYGQLQYGFSEKTKYSPGLATPDVANNSRTGRNIAGRFGYANGPLDVAVAYGSSTVGDQFYVGTTTKINTLNLGASYDFGPVKLFGEVSKSKNKVDYEVTPFLGGRPDVDLTGYLLGVTVPVGAGLIRASYSHVKYDNNAPVVLFAPEAADPKANKLALGYVHNLSKRTALYATIARVSNKNGAALTVGGPAFINNAVFTPKNSTGYDFGIRHAF
ncbi:putative porin [Variovorax paradoxus B4]|uniref:Putative porin n=1 Tax=Variovorax paradoxus B4 TaxID=1246301 RepID=T1X6Q3_VARPD|nr:porin [Variovorax paradoxus]AGU48258.1 putative porin [Variovorax paradoxus B4]